jgi:hypothetical protein
MKHNGGPIPCDPDDQVVVKYHNGNLSGASLRDGITAAPIRAGDRKWNWRADRRNPLPFDIVEWWPLEAVAERLAA